MKRRPFALLVAFGLIGLLALAAPAAAATWSSAGSMAIERLAHKDALLADGRVLVTGGWSPASGNGGYDTKLAEIYDPSTNTWSPTGSTANGRTDHTATSLADGKVLVVGGENANICTNDVTSEVYDPATGSWAFSGNAGVARTGATATRLLDGKVLLVGGGNRCGGVFSSAELYDPATGTWSYTGSMGTPREWHSAVRLLDGKVLVAGGATPVGGLFPTVSSAEIYDPATGTWSPTGSMATTRFSFPLTLLGDGRVLTAAGYSGNGFSSSPNDASVEIFDPATGTWTPTGSLSVQRSGGTFSLLDDGSVLGAGGTDGAVMHASAELWDPSTGTWAETGSLATARAGHSATVLMNGDVLAAGGYQDNPRVYLSSAELFEVNEPPTVEVGGGHCLHDTKAKGVLDLLVGDPDGDAASLTLSATSDNQALVPDGNIVLGGSGSDRTLSLIAYPGRSGTAVLTIAVNDGTDSTAIEVTVEVGDGAGNALAGTAGPDMIFGLGGSDTLDGGGDSDLLCGGTGLDTLNGGDGSDVLDGDGSNDVLNGGNGDDSLLGGAGRDNLTGAAGADFFSGGFGVDTNTDFNPAEGDTQDGT